MRTASRPSAWIDWSTVVSGGSVSADSGMLSNPTTDSSSGTRIPSSAAVRIVWIADRSLAAKIAVGAVGQRQQLACRRLGGLLGEPADQDEIGVERDAGLVERRAVARLAAPRRLEVGSAGEEPDPAMAEADQ